MLKGTIEGKKDVAGGRLTADRVTAKSSTKNKHFNSASFNPTGEMILAGGNSKYVCLYQAE
jgi:periodic tryptophan protein 2